MLKFSHRLATGFIALAAVIFSDAAVHAASAQCMMGEVKMFAGNFAPKSWALANGQLLPISSNQALFSILGVTFGGDGRTTFALPDLRGRAPVGTGSNYQAGQSFGQETIMLTASNLPAHSHSATTSAKLSASSSTAATGAASGAVLAKGRTDQIYNTSSPTTPMSSDAAKATTTVANAGASTPVQNMQPSQGINYIICTVGIYPSRN